MSIYFPNISVSATTVTQGFEDSTIRSKFESGFVVSRNKFTRDRSTFNIEYKVLSREDKDLLVDFSKEVRGAAIFTWMNPDEALPMPSVWVANATYIEDQDVEYNGVAYSAVVGHTGSVITPELDTTNWYPNSYYGEKYVVRLSTFPEVPSVGGKYGIYDISLELKEV